MKNLTWQNPEPLGFAASRVEELFVAQVLIKKVKLKYCGIKENIEMALPIFEEFLYPFLLTTSKKDIVMMGENPKTGKCPKCGGDLEKTDVVLMVD